MKDQDDKLVYCSDMLLKHREMLEEQRRGLSSNGDHVNKISAKLDKTREGLMNEI